jgi:hypothetical protein
MSDGDFRRLTAAGTPAEQAAVSAAALTRRRCLCQEEDGAPPCECTLPVTREQVGRLHAYQARQHDRTLVASEQAVEWMAALTAFLPAGDDPVITWMRDPFALPTEADLRHAADLGDLLDMLGAPPAAALS